MFCRIFALDVRRSLLGRWKRFSVALLFFVLVTFACKISFSNAYLQSPQLTPFATPTLGDFLLYAFGGCDGVRNAGLTDRLRFRFSGFCWSCLRCISTLT